MTRDGQLAATGSMIDERMEAARQRYRAKSSGSRAMHERAERVLPAGTVSSTQASTIYPLYIHRAEGSRLYDVDGNEIIDLMNANGSVTLGHHHPAITAAVCEQVQRGFAFQLPGDNVVEFAELLQKRTPSLERMRFTCSGTEATMFAMRLARVFTGRPRLLLMDGCYHGFHDVGSVGDGPFRGECRSDSDPSKPVALGVDTAVAATVEFGQFNDLEHCSDTLARFPGEFAAVVVEPMLGAGGNIAADAAFLRGLRELCDREGTLLVFDESITYSVSDGAAQGFYGVSPDLTIAGKPIANGMPVSLFGGRADIMDLCVPHGGRARLQHSSSFTAHPVTMAAGAATLRTFDRDVVATLARLGDYVREGLRRTLSEEGVVGQVTGLQHLFGLHFVDGPVLGYGDIRKEQPGLRGAIAHSLLSQGYLMSGYRGALNAAITTAEIDGFLAAMRNALHEAGLTG